MSIRKSVRLPFFSCTLGGRHSWRTNDHWVQIASLFSTMTTIYIFNGNKKKEQTPPFWSQKPLHWTSSSSPTLYVSDTYIVHHWHYKQVQDVTLSCTSSFTINSVNFANTHCQTYSHMQHMLNFLPHQSLKDYFIAASLGCPKSRPIRFQVKSIFFFMRWTKTK